MTQSFRAGIDNVVIASAGTRTRTINAAEDYSDATSIYIQSPAALDAVTYTIRVSQNGTDWATLNDGTADIGPPAAGKGRQYIEMIGFKHWEIFASGAAAADRTFLVSKQFTI